MKRVINRAQRLVFVILLFAGAGGAVFAQETAVIDGVVTDESGGALPGATVTVKNMETGTERTVVTDGSGRYRFPALPPGRYSLKTEIQGFAAEERRDIVLTIGLSARQDFQIKAIYEAAYAGTHWIATYIVDYLVSANRAPATD